MDSDNTMASILKRKRAPVEVLETPKRSKSIKSNSGNPLRKISDNTGWDAAFNPPKTEIAKTNGVNGEDLNGGLVSPEPVDYEAFVEEQRQKHLDNQISAPELAKSAGKKGLQPWKLSEPIGGRMINADPVFTIDEKFLILANRTTINVYSTLNSLLTRTIKLKINPKSHSSTRIISYCLSPTNSNILWVACSDGTVFSVDWTTSAGTEHYWTISSSGCIHMTVASMESAGRRQDVVFTTEVKPSGGFRITANELVQSAENKARTIYTSPERIQFLKTANEGSVIVGASGKRILLGRIRSTEYGTIDKIRYEFRVFESTDAIKSLDVRASDRIGSDKKSSLKKVPVVDLVVGDVRGVVFVHNDLLAKLFQQTQDGKLPPGINLIPQKMHWHRQAVHTAKWSRDGNYIISGGTETVLVLWQLDTGKRQYLPHMSSTIQNVVVSPRGASYAVQLADNSAMILSTAELEPTANVAGIQAPAIQSEDPLESQVRRIEETSWKPPLIQRTPAVINPADPSHLLLGVGQLQEINSVKPIVMSNPFLQTFDLGSGHNVARQALTRTNVTNVNAAPNAHRLTEPRVTYIKISHDGKWLATVDEWIPPLRDVGYLKLQKINLSIEQQHRREVFLKFWQWSKETETWELVSRIDSPHSLGKVSSDAGKILDLAVDPSSLRFATIGEDGVVCTWAPKIRKRDGVVVHGKDGSAFRNWHCQHAISLGKPQLLDASGNLDRYPASGSIAFSEDGSILAAACDNTEGLLHLLDPETGIIRHSQTGMFEKDIIKIEFLGQDLITLSDKIFVFDIVAEEVRFNIKMAASTTSLSCKQKQEMMHLAVDDQSRTFAVALPSLSDEGLWAANSELLVFHQDKREPQLRKRFPTVITALMPFAGSEGYLVLDTSAEIYTVLKQGTQAVTTLAQSTSALQLDDAPEEPTSSLIQLVEEAEEVEEYQQPTPAPSQDGDEGEIDDEFPVVTQQQLSQIFDIGPSFALPPLEEMFYQVAGLFSSKPLAQSV